MWNSTLLSTPNVQSFCYGRSKIRMLRLNHAFGCSQCNAFSLDRFLGCYHTKSSPRPSSSYLMIVYCIFVEQSALWLVRIQLTKADTFVPIWGAWQSVHVGRGVFRTSLCQWQTDISIYSNQNICFSKHNAHIPLRDDATVFLYFCVIRLAGSEPADISKLLAEQKYVERFLYVLGVGQ